MCFFPDLPTTVWALPAPRYHPLYGPFVACRVYLAAVPFTCARFHSVPAPGLAAKVTLGSLPPASNARWQPSHLSRDTTPIPPVPPRPVRPHPLNVPGRNLASRT